MKKIAVTLLGVIATFSAAIAATDSLLQRAHESFAPAAAVVTAGNEPVSLSGALIAAAVLAVGFLATRRRGD